MKAYDLAELAVRNLRESVLRNSLTTIGISVGVASLVAMLSLGVGLQRLVSRQLGRSGLFDSIFVTSRQDIRNDRRQEAKPDEIKPLDNNARKRIQEIPGVVEVYPDIRGVNEFHFAAPNHAEESYVTILAGLPMSARRSDVFDELQGSFFSGAHAPEAIILSDFGRQLLGIAPVRGQFDDKLTTEQASQLLGKELMLRYAERQSSDNRPTDPMGFNVLPKEQKLKIIGIVNNEPYGGGRGVRARVFLPLELAESLNMFQGGDAVIRSERLHLIAPCVPEIGKAVDHDNQRAFT